LGTYWRRSAALNQCQPPHKLARAKRAVEDVLERVRGRNRAAPEHSRKGAMPPAARGLISSTTLIADGCRPRTDEVSDHLGFRAIHKMGNIRFLSRVIWGNAWVIRWRHCRQVGTTSCK